MTPKTSPTLACTFHRDGTVSHWDAYTMRWNRCKASDISERVVDTFLNRERKRIAKMVSK